MGRMGLPTRSHACHTAANDAIWDDTALQALFHAVRPPPPPPPGSIHVVACQPDQKLMHSFFLMAGSRPGLRPERGYVSVLHLCFCYSDA